MNEKIYTRLEDKLTKQDEKLDRQTEILMDIQLEVAKEINILKLAHQKLKHTTMTLGVVLLIIIAVEYPKLVRVLKGII